MMTGAMVSSGACVGKEPPPRSHGCWEYSVSGRLSDRRPHFLGGCQPETTLSSLPCGSSQHDHLLPQSLPGSESLCKTGIIILWNIITEMTSLSPLPLYGWKKVTGATHLQGKGHHRVTNIRKQR